MAAGAFPSVAAAQAALCPAHRVIEPDASTARVYHELFGFYREIYFGFGSADAQAIRAGGVLPGLREIAASLRGQA